jgi:flagellar hook-associated protein 1 FlgK
MFSAIDTVTSALSAFQQELDVTGNNISNVNTPGYSQEVANLQQGPTYQYVQGNAATIGSGVQVGSVTRIQSMFLQQSSQSASSDTGRLNTMQSGLNSVQSALNEPGSDGISAALSGFFNAWSGLASSPSDTSQQLNVQTAATTLTSRVQSTYQQLTQITSQTTSGINSTLQSIQTQINQLASLNQQIQQQSAQGAIPNGLMDQRDQDLNTLSNLVNINTTFNADNTVNVTMGGMTLVNQSGAITVPTNWSSTASTLTDASGNAWPVTGGTLAGQFGVLNTVNGYTTQLNTLANTITSSVNSVYATGTNSSGTTGANFFTSTNPPGGAAGFSLDPAIAASSSAIATGTSGNASDGGVALAIANLTSQSQAALGNTSVTSFYNSFVSTVGQQANYYQSAVTTQSSITTQIQNQIQSVSGVNLDDEMSSMLNFQRSYQAAAEALTTFNSTMDSLLAILQ